MEFFGMGPTEILLILIVAMIFLGPGKVADLGRQLGKAMNSFRKASSEITASVNSEMEQLKIDPSKPPSGPSPSIMGTETLSTKAELPSATGLIPKSSPTPSRPADNIDSPGAGI